MKTKVRFGADRCSKIRFTLPNFPFQDWEWLLSAVILCEASQAWTQLRRNKHGIVMSWDSKTIVRKMYEAVDDLRRLDKQRLQHYIAALRCRPGEEVFDTLMAVFSDPNREQTRYLDQEYTGRLLFALQPPCPSDVGNVIHRILAT